MTRQLAVGRGTDADAFAELPLDPGGDPDERRDGDVRPALAEERMLELRVRPVERVVVPVEAATRLRDAYEEIDEDGAEERIVLGGMSAGVGTRVDPRRRLADELLERDRGVLAPSQPIGARLDEVANEWPVLVERRAVLARVLLECERQRLPGVLELPQEVRERAEDECAKRVMELWRPNGHVSPYAPPGANPVSGGALGRAGHLAPRAPVGGPVSVAEPARADRRAAARTGPTRTPVDGPDGAGTRNRRPHLRLGPLEPARERRDIDVSGRDPRRQPPVPEELGEPQVPDPGDEPLVEEGIAEETRRARCDDPPRERVGVRACREQIRAEPEVGAGREPERRAVPESRLELRAAQDEPRPAE